MAGENRDSTHDVAKRLSEDPAHFDFFHAVRSLECARPGTPGTGRTVRAADDVVRFGQEPTLRFAPEAVWRSAGDAQDGSVWPALLGLVSIDRRIAAVHRTFLAPDGSGKAPVAKPKMVLGPAGGGAIRFGLPASKLLVAEGIETTLSVMQALPRRTYWCGVSLWNMARLRLPDGVAEVTLLMDSDMKDPDTGRKALEAARIHYGNQGVKLRAAWAPPGKDFNDVLNGG